MINFNIEDVQNILRKCNVNDLVVHPHILDNWFERDYNLNYVANCLVNEVPLSISKTCENRFKLIYPHEKNKNDDLYIIIVIDDFDNVEVLTVYSFNKSRRERDIERK